MVYNYIKIEELVSYKYGGYVASNLSIPKPDSFLPCAHACRPYNKNARNINPDSEFRGLCNTATEYAFLYEYIWYWKSQLWFVSMTDALKLKSTQVVMQLCWGKSVENRLFSCTVNKVWISTISIERNLVEITDFRIYSENPLKLQVHAP